MPKAFRPAGNLTESLLRAYRQKTIGKPKTNDRFCQSTFVKKSAAECKTAAAI
jgi:hypothetical protein